MKLICYSILGWLVGKFDWLVGDFIMNVIGRLPLMMMYDPSYEAQPGY